MKKMLMTMAVIATSTALGSFTFASTHDCGAKGVTEKQTIETVTSLSYESSVPKKNLKMKDKQEEVKVELIKRFVAKMNDEQRDRFVTILHKYMEKIGEMHPKFYILQMLYDYIHMEEDVVHTDTITDIVVATQEVSILKDIVVALDLADTLASEGPFTVFAPTNEAFADLLVDLDMTLEEVLANEELLKTIVLYHVVGSNIYAEDVLALTEGTLVETVQGESVRVSNWNGVFVDDSEVITTDIKASNGLIHLIDTVLLPPSVRDALGLPTDRGEEDVVATAIDTGLFPTLVAAIQAAGLVEALQTTNPITVFAPTEEAFADLLTALDMTAEELLADTDLLTDVLTYHVVPAFYTADDVAMLDMPTDFDTLQGSSVRLSYENNIATVNDTLILQTDVFASNGVIHVIDAVLLP